jgi:predicted RNase H-like HicB family nuclease
MNGMKVKVIVHKADEGGYWAEVPALPGCFSQGESIEEVKANIAEAIEGVLSVEAHTREVDPDTQVIELAL